MEGGKARTHSQFVYRVLPTSTLANILVETNAAAIQTQRPAKSTSNGVVRRLCRARIFIRSIHI
jgi:hypothetical protein